MVCALGNTNIHREWLRQNSVDWDGNGPFTEETFHSRYESCMEPERKNFGDGPNPTSLSVL